MGQRGTQTWRKLCTHREQVQPEQELNKMGIFMGKLENALDVFTTGYEKFIIRIFIPAFILFMFYQLTRVGWI